MNETNNICKFIPTINEEILIASLFIYETNIVNASTTSFVKTYGIYLALSNEGTFCFNDHEETIEKGSIYFLFPNETFCVKGTNKVEYIYIHFDGGRSKKLCMDYKITPNNRKFTNCDSLIPFWKECIIQSNEDNIELIAESVILYSFAKLSSVVTRENDLFLSLIKFVDNNYQNHSLNLDIVAKELGYHPKYISIKFKQFAGIGFNQYLSNTRIKHALQLLNYGIKSIKNVAILCGFNDPLYFSKVFKNIVGISPKDYLALNDENRNKINIM